MKVYVDEYIGPNLKSSGTVTKSQCLYFSCAVLHGCIKFSGVKIRLASRIATVELGVSDFAYRIFA